jgi:hypothetical protein
LPNSSASSGAIDFVTALARLLADGGLRDAFGADGAAFAEQWKVRPSDRALLLQLVPGDLEFQAQVLLRKRFDHVRAALPQTCARLADAAWPLFARFARTAPNAARDAVDFCGYLAAARRDAICPLEYNRCLFAAGGGRCAIRFVLARAGPRKWRQPTMQLLLGGRGDRWHEWCVSLRLG